MPMQTDVFPRTSGARNPIVIVNIFIFLLLKVVLQAKLCKGGRPRKFFHKFAKTEKLFRTPPGDFVRSA